MITRGFVLITSDVAGLHGFSHLGCLAVGRERWRARDKVQKRTTRLWIYEHRKSMHMFTRNLTEIFVLSSHMSQETKSTFCEHSVFHRADSKWQGCCRLFSKFGPILQTYAHAASLCWGEGTTGGVSPGKIYTTFHQLHLISQFFTWKVLGTKNKAIS